MPSKSAEDPSICPISGLRGDVRRSLSGKELYKLYETYHRHPISPEYFCIPFDETITEYHSAESGLIWYAPCLLGDGEYYAHLSKIYPRYYNPGSWDKIKCMELLVEGKPDWIIEIGSGDGWLLERLRERNIPAIGIEINGNEIVKCRKKNLSVYHPDESFSIPEGDGIICMLQTIEHVKDPYLVLSEYISKYKPRHLHLSAPCFESLLGYTSDPLAWPPHHATSWSQKAMIHLGRKLGYEIIQTMYSPSSYAQYMSARKKEVGGRLFRIINIPKWPIGFLLYYICRIFRVHWSIRGHSIYSVFKLK